MLCCRSLITHLKPRFPYSRTAPGTLPPGNFSGNSEQFQSCCRISSVHQKVVHNTIRPCVYTDKEAQSKSGELFGEFQDLDIECQSWRNMNDNVKMTEIVNMTYIIFVSRKVSLLYNLCINCSLTVAYVQRFLYGISTL